LSKHPTILLANGEALKLNGLKNKFLSLGGGGAVHLKKIALRGWATGKYGYKGIGHTKVSGGYTKLHPPPPNAKINSLIYNTSVIGCSVDQNLLIVANMQAYNSETKIHSSFQARRVY
jgi:hypothetical protein